MSKNVNKLVSAYLTLWKALDIYFSGHAFLEATDESEKEVLEELHALSKESFDQWTNDPSELKHEILSTIQRVNDKTKDQNWHNEARILKQTFQDKALQFAAELPDPPPLSITAEAGR